ncbi:hypothetical protein HDV63DRAFT_378783 [Trichoderma sp. SZMC 28014]
MLCREIWLLWFLALVVKGKDGPYRLSMLSLNSTHDSRNSYQSANIPSSSRSRRSGQKEDCAMSLNSAKRGLAYNEVS